MGAYWGGVGENIDLVSGNLNFTEYSNCTQLQQPDLA